MRRLVHLVDKVMGWARRPVLASVGLPFTDVSPCGPAGAGVLGGPASVMLSAAGYSDSRAGHAPRDDGSGDEQHANQLKIPAGVGARTRLNLDLDARRVGVSHECHEVGDRGRNLVQSARLCDFI